MKFKKRTEVELKQAEINFIIKASNIHNNKYDYSLTVYTGTKNRVKIICPTHGTFIQFACVHLRGIGCKFCSLGNKPSVDIVISKFQSVHGAKYRYEFVYYQGSNIKVNIICKIHGIFSQTPSSHLQGNGCNQCRVENAIGSYNEMLFLKKPEMKNKPSMLYLVKLVDKYGQIFTKIGITIRSIEDRFYTEPNISVVDQYQFDMPLFKSVIVEQQIKETFFKYRLFPNVKMSGRTECFKLAIFNDILKHLQETLI